MAIGKSRPARSSSLLCRRNSRESGRWSGLRRASFHRTPTQLSFPEEHAMRPVRLVLIGFVAASGPLPLRCTRGDEYSFVEIARTSGFGGSGFAEMLSPASLNNLGEVAFLAKDG